MSATTAVYTQHPSYIMDRPGATNFLQSNQEDWRKSSDEAVEQTVNQITDGVKAEKSLTKLFHEIITNLGQLRAGISAEAGDKSGTFGIKRDLETSGAIWLNTPLSHPYEEYNAVITKVIAFLLRQIYSTSGRFKAHEVFTEDKCLGRNTSFRVTILSQSDFPQTPLLSDEELIAAIEPEVLEKWKGKREKSEMIVSTTIMKSFKTKSKELYLQEKMTASLFCLESRFPHTSTAHLYDNSLFITPPCNENLKAAVVSATLRLEVDGKMYAMSQYLTWMNCLTKNPIDSMQTVTIIHQDGLLIEDMLQDIAKIFEKAINWDKENIVDLKNQVALLRFEFAHTVPFIRGSAAIAEWLERAIYQYHGYQVLFNNNKLTDLEALSSYSLSVFIKNYDSMIQLEPLAEPTTSEPTNS